MLQEPFDVDRTMRAMAARTGTPYVSLIDMLCTGHDCRTLAAPGVPMQFDYGHLTSAGSAIVVAGLMPRIVTMTKQPSKSGPGAR
jgi:predicted TIM-barrel enzyme